MNKKEYLLTILNALLGSRPLAKNLKLLIENDKLPENAVNILFKVFQDAVGTISDKIKKTKLYESIAQTEQIKVQEQQNKQEDQISVSRLDNLIRYL